MEGEEGPAAAAAAARAPGQRRSAPPLHAARQAEIPRPVYGRGTPTETANVIDVFFLLLLLLLLT